MRNIGIYGGTFDPIHHGHLILAREAAEQLDLHQLIFVPAAMSPQKTARPSAAGTSRLAMLRAAVADEPRFAVDDLELNRPPPSFTIDTVAAFAARIPNAKLFLLVGEDNVATLQAWHRFDELRAMIEFVVLERSGLKINHPYRRVRRQIDISATDIRNRVASGASIRYLVPAAVDEIICGRQLYRDP